MTARRDLALMAAFGALLVARFVPDQCGVVPIGGDGVTHLYELERFADILRRGAAPTWVTDYNGGHPMLASYQPFVSIVMGYLFLLLDAFEARVCAFNVSALVPWALLPAAAYAGGRMLSLGRPAALLLGVVSVAAQGPLHFGQELSATFGTGLYTQAFAMPLLMLTIGALWRYLGGSGVTLVTMAMLWAATVLTHLFLGMGAGLVALAMVFASPAGVRVAARRLLGALALTALLLTPWLLFLIEGRGVVGGQAFEGAYYLGPSPGELGSLLVRGRLLDDGRLPWLSVLLVPGVVALARLRRTGVWVALAVAATVLLLVGRHLSTAAYALIPFHVDIQAVRYIAVLQALLVVVAALGGAELLRLCGRLVPEARRPAAFAAALAAAMLLVGADFHRRLATFGRPDAMPADWRALADAIAAGPPGRVAGLQALGTESAAHSSFLPLLGGRPASVSFGRGSHDSSAYWYFARVQPNHLHLRLFNINQVLSSFPVIIDGFTAGAVTKAGQLFQAAHPSSYFEVVDVPLAIVGEGMELKEAVHAAYMHGYPKGLLPAIGAGADGAQHVAATARATIPALVGAMAAAARPPGAFVESEQAGAAEYGARVAVRSQAAWVLLKVSYYPAWRATVDGVEAPVVRLGPSFMGVRVGTGVHDVRFEFERGAAARAAFLLLQAMVPALLVLLTRAALRPKGRNSPDSTPG